MLSASPERQASGAHFQGQNRASALGSPGVRRELVRRIVHSPTFARSEKLGNLLTYVCDLALSGREAEINEQKIGQAVFGRSRDYDSSADGIVRSQASRLRHRLELYYRQEGADEPIRVIIPRGGYVPIFESHSLLATPPAVSDSTVSITDTVPLVPPSGTQLEPKSSRSPNWLPWSLTLLLLVFSISFWIHNRRHTILPTTMARHPFWSQLFQASEPTMIVAPDSGLVLYHALSAKDVDLKQYLEGGYRSEVNGQPPTGPTASQRDRVLDLANRRYTSMVDLNAILSIRDRAKTLGSDVSVRYARDLRPNDLKRGTVVLLGAYTANPWVELFAPKLNFVLKDDYVENFSIFNRSPLKGEPASWVSSRDDPEHRAFGVVAYVANLAGNGNALLLEGVGMSGTEAAMDFLDDDTQLMPFLAKIKRPDGTIPHFELVIETRNVDASATQSKILAWHVTD